MAFRNTIADTFTALMTHLEEMEGEKGNSELELRKVAPGEGGIGEYAVPFLTVRVSKIEVSGDVDGDKTWKVDLKFRIVSQVVDQASTQLEILYRVAQVEDQLDTFERPAGVTGLEDGKWSPSPSLGSEGGNHTVAEAIKTYTVVVARGEN
jgi:hypothetical protein